MILSLPDLACLRDLVPVFTEPTARRFLVLLAAAILTRGRHTVANLVRIVRALAPGHRTSYQRVLSAARWSPLRLACAFSRFRIRRPLPDGPILLVGDDTSRATPVRTSTATPATATPADPRIPTPPGNTDTAGSSWPCRFTSPLLPAPGPCPS
jgi:hypothetical protein